MTEANSNDKPSTAAHTAAEQSHTTNAVALLPESESVRLPTEPTIGDVVQSFLADIRSIQKTYQIVLKHVLNWLKEKHTQNAATFEKYATQDKSKLIAKSAHEASEILSSIREIESLGGLRIPETLQRSLFTQMFSEFDAFVGALLKVIYKRKADLLKGIRREISFDDLLSYDNLNAIKLDMLEKEIETFRRDSYVDQFKSLENKFNIKLRSFPEWGEFVEFSQRRNLIVHNGAKVSEQYLLVCDREGHKFNPRPEIGRPLKLTSEYFSRAVIVVSKVGFMLAHTLWSKMFPGEREIAHSAANEVIFNLLKDKRWITAAEIAQFCLTEPMKKDIRDIDLRIRTINTAIALKFKNDHDKCLSTIKSLDWTATYRDFRLAILVLEDDFKNASILMKEIGKKGELLDQLAYHEWPLFHKFRESVDFLSAYNEIYNVSFILKSVQESSDSAKFNDPKSY